MPKRLRSKASDGISSTPGRPVTKKGRKSSLHQPVVLESVQEASGSAQLEPTHKLAAQHIQSGSPKSLVDQSAGQSSQSVPPEEDDVLLANLGEPEEVDQGLKSSLKPSAAEPKAPSKGAPVLPWMRVPIEIEAGNSVPFSLVRGLDSRLRGALLKCGYEELFPVQSAAWRALAGGMSIAHDLCICAPTGSGKTLAYALPILQGLLGRPHAHLGALLVLPTRELAVQVYDVFAKLCPAVGLWVGLAAARLSLPAEAKALSSGVLNVLVATPGRLMAHLRAPVPTISLENLRFLVVDETDRLLRQSYQDWLPFIVAATATKEERRWGAATAAGVIKQRIVKVVVSATLTQDPAKIDRLGLHAPRYIAMSAADHRYKVPKQLKEYKLVGAAPDKPLLLMALLEHLRPARVIVFTASLQATHRLYVLLSHVPSLAAEVAEYSSSAGGRSFKAGLASFKAGSRRVLVASDAMTRGMDVQGVEAVVNYDPPVYAKTYVHRAGRTARAGMEGKVITLLRAEEVRHFKGMLRKVDNAFVKDFSLPANLASSLRPEFQEALEQAGAALKEAAI